MSETTTWYQAHLTSNAVTPVEVVKVTPHQIRIREHGREYTRNRVAEYATFHPTEREAANAVRKHWSVQVYRVKARLAYAEDELAKALTRVTTLNPAPTESPE